MRPWASRPMPRKMRSSVRTANWPPRCTLTRRTLPGARRRRRSSQRCRRLTRRVAQAAWQLLRSSSVNAARLLAESRVKPPHGSAATHGQTRAAPLPLQVLSDPVKRDIYDIYGREVRAVALLRGRGTLSLKQAASWRRRGGGAAPTPSHPLARTRLRAARPRPPSCTGPSSWNAARGQFEEQGGVTQGLSWGSPRPDAPARPRAPPRPAGRQLRLPHLRPPHPAPPRRRSGRPFRPSSGARLWTRRWGGGHGGAARARACVGQRRGRRQGRCRPGVVRPRATGGPCPLTGQLPWGVRVQSGCLRCVCA